MRGRWLILVAAGFTLGLAGCGSDPPAPKPLSAEEEKQFEQERRAERSKEAGRSASIPPP